MESPSSTRSSPPQQVRLWFCHFLAFFASRLSFIILVDLLIISRSLSSTFFHIHSINYTFKMKYQLIALPALAASVAAQDLYVDTFRSNQYRSSTDSIAATPSSACSRLPSPAPPPSAARSPPSSPLARLPRGSPPCPPTSRATSSPPTSPASLP